MKGLFDAGAALASIWAMAGGPGDSIVELASRYGLAAAAVAWFMWRDWKREQAANDELNKRHEQITDLLAGQIKQNTAAMDKCEERQETRRRGDPG